MSDFFVAGGSSANFRNNIPDYEEKGSGQEYECVLDEKNTGE
jgi:hypothetical protein